MKQIWQVDSQQDRMLNNLEMKSDKNILPSVEEYLNDKIYATKVPTEEGEPESEMSVNRNAFAISSYPFSDVGARAARDHLIIIDFFCRPVVPPVCSVLPTDTDRHWMKSVGGERGGRGNGCHWSAVAGTRIFLCSAGSP